MAAEMIATDRGPAILLPSEWAVWSSDFEVHALDRDSLIVSVKRLSSGVRIEDYFSQPADYPGLTAPDDPAPEVVPSF